MVERTVIVASRVGLHARPAMLFTQAAAASGLAVTIARPSGEPVDATSIMFVMSLGVPHGAPIRLRVERQLGYKQAKYVMRIEAVSSLAMIGGGNGGFWEDRGYEWYAGI